MLYSLSGGGWNNQWFDPSLGRELEVEPLKVWAGSEADDFLYATILSGIPPRLVVFDLNGEATEERRFDLADPDVASTIEEVANQYSRSGEATLEMVSLAEYLREDDPSWRKVEITSAFNFRNQHKRPKESQRIEEVAKLTRAEAKGELQSRLGEREVPDGASDRDIEIKIGREPDMARGAKSRQREPMLQNEGGRITVWPFVVGGIAILGVAIILIRAFMRSRRS